LPGRVYPDPGRSTGRRLDVEDDAAGQWLDVNSAAEELGVSTDAVRKRISRGTLRSDREDGTVRVWLDDGGTEAGREAQVDGGALVEVLRDEIAHLRRESERKDTIIMSLSQSNAELSRTIRALEAPAEDPREPEVAAETVEAEPEATESRSAEGEVREELSAERVRREMAESTMHEGMAEERRRREEAERERDGLRRELFGLRGREDAHEVAEEQQGRGRQIHPDTPSAHGPQRRTWWRRIFRN
jgi:hypothetical protein